MEEDLVITRKYAYSSQSLPDGPGGGASDETDTGRTELIGNNLKVDRYSENLKCITSLGQSLKKMVYLTHK